VETDAAGTQYSENSLRSRFELTANTGYFDCGFAPAGRSKILAQDDRELDIPPDPIYEKFTLL
jgi:hypothetical protein